APASRFPHLLRIGRKSLRGWTPEANRQVGICTTPGRPVLTLASGRNEPAAPLTGGSASPGLSRFASKCAKSTQGPIPRGEGGHHNGRGNQPAFPRLVEDAFRGPLRHARPVRQA